MFGGCVYKRYIQKDTAQRVFFLELPNGVVGYTLGTTCRQGTFYSKSCTFFLLSIVKYYVQDCKHSKLAGVHGGPNFYLASGQPVEATVIVTLTKTRSLSASCAQCSLTHTSSKAMHTPLYNVRILKRRRLHSE